MTKVVSVIKADGEREIFSREKLEQSLRKVGATPEVIEAIVLHIEKEIMDDMSTTDIYRHAFNLLRERQKHVAVRYSLRRALAGLGPTGFPFESYISEIFKARGFAVETDQIVQGACVPHEVDVVAYNEQKLIMAEVKFHNEYGYKSDLKVALYVKARMDDLMKSSFLYGGKSRKLDEGWLVTNTKFSQTAIDYGKCVGMTMLGWNYPEKGSLEQLIEEYRLHPLSCLSSLGATHKQALFKRGVVLVKSLKGNNTLLAEIGLNQAKIAEVQEEVAML